MRYKITLDVAAEVYGSVLPISYQHELSMAVRKLVTANTDDYHSWLSLNGFTDMECNRVNLYSVSNLYIPKIYVQSDRLQINAPRVQFWMSFYPEEQTTAFINHVLMGKEIVLGDSQSRVLFRVSGIDVVSPVVYQNVMEYQALSPVLVLGLRRDRTVEYLLPYNRYFAEFFVQDLIERWECIHHRPYYGDRNFRFELLQGEKRKAVSLTNHNGIEEKVVGYLIKFRLTLAPELQEIAYVCGIGDYLDCGFGYLELLKNPLKKTKNVCENGKNNNFYCFLPIYNHIFLKINLNIRKINYLCGL